VPEAVAAALPAVRRLPLLPLLLALAVLLLLLLLASRPRLQGRSTGSGGALLACCCSVSLLVPAVPQSASLPGRG
jgi:hypothetical protein